MMDETDVEPTAEENRFFDRCVKPVTRPAWLDALTDEVPALQKSRESGDVVILVSDPDGDLKLCGFLIASGGQIVYEIQSDVAIQEETPFWSFAAANYVWLTPTIKLRKAVAAEMGGKADGQSFKLSSDGIAIEAFIEAVAGVAVPREGVRLIADLAPGESLSMF